MLNEVKKLLAERALIHLENDFEIEKYWNLLIDILSKDEDQTIEVINQLDETEIAYLSEVFEDISENLQSEKYINCLKSIGKKYTNIPIASSIKTAEELLDRSGQIAIMRSIGMEKSKTFLYLFLELMILISVFTGLGILIGSGLHCLIIKGMNSLYDVKIASGIQVSEYVAAVTFSPWIYTILVLEISSIIAIFVPLLRMIKATPIDVFEKRFVREKQKMKRHFSDFSKCSWKKLLGKHIRFHDRFVLVITCVVMSSCFLAYNYFRVLSEFNNTEYEFTLEESGLEEWDYTASKTTMAMLYEFLIENHHDYGIDQKAYQNFANYPFIEQSFARIVNKSTRLSYEKNEANQLPDFLRLRRNSASSDSYENALYEAENAMIQQVGYSSEEEIYALPSIGITESEFDPLFSYVKEGAINLEKIRSFRRRNTGK